MSTAATSINVINQISDAIVNVDAHTWTGKFDNQPQDVAAGRVGLISHSGKPVSGAGVAYRVKNAGQEWNWVFAWSFEVQGLLKIFNALQSPGNIDWDNVREHLRVATDIPASIAGLKTNLHAATQPGTGTAYLTATITYG